MSMQTEISRKWAAINGWRDLCDKINRRGGFTVINSRRTITERMAKRIRRGQTAPLKNTPSHLILKWAAQYATCRVAA